jgi:hypothetical protein
MAQTSARPRATQLTSRSTMPLFQTAINALTAGCLLLGIVAFLHEESPVSRFVTERGVDGQSDVPAQPNADRLGAIEAIASHSAQRSSAGDVGQNADHSSARSGENSSRFWNASQSASVSSGGPAIHLGPLFGLGDSTRQAPSRAAVNEFSSGPDSLVRRAYRPTSMSVASLERLVRPLLSARGATVATSTDSTHASDSPLPVHGVSEIAGADPPGVLIVSDRPEAIGRIDALCQDLESTSPRIAIDLAVVSILPDGGRSLPWNQWRDSFGIIDSDLPVVLNQVRGMGRAIVRASSQLQAMSGTWAELECVAQAAGPASSPNESAAVVNTGVTTTTLHIRPSRQSDGDIRIEVRAQSSRLEDHAPAERPQLVTVRFNTEVVLRDGATGVVNLFVDQPLDAGSAEPGSNNRAVAAPIAPGGVAIPATKILPQPGKREQTLLLLMPRIASSPTAPGKIAASHGRDPA